MMTAKISTPTTLNVSAVLTTVKPVTVIALEAVKKASEKLIDTPGFCEIGKYNRIEEIHIRTR
jgi:hypothetical protein